MRIEVFLKIITAKTKVTKQLAKTTLYVGSSVVENRRELGK